MKWCKQIMGIQLESSRVVWTLCAVARSLESEAKASVAQSINIEESIAINRGCINSMRVSDLTYLRRLFKKVVRQGRRECGD